MDIGHPSELLKLIMKCPESSPMKILWNGIATREFKPTRGVRQGNPHSPYLFVLCLERLAHLTETEVSKDIWKPFWVGRRGPLSLIYFFADDM